MDFNAQYVQLSLNGALLFESGKSDVMEEAYPVVNKISSILATYQDNLIEIEGHTDNVPVSSRSKYESNDVLSMYRALSVANYIRDNTSLNPAHISHPEEETMIRLRTTLLQMEGPGTDV